MKSWYLIYSKPREEKLAQEHLERQGYEIYLPLILGRIRKRGRTEKSIQPMFPRYLFIYLSDRTDNWGPIRSTIGVSNLVKFGINAAKLPEDLIIKLKENEENKGFHDLPDAKLKCGDNLIIAEGPFEGYEATLFSKNAHDRVTVLLKITEKHIKIVLNQSFVEKSDHSSL
jgi:transcriptional antiterminator RfaH